MRNLGHVLIRVLIILLLVQSQSLVWAADKADKKGGDSSESRSKSLEFESGLVEGLGKVKGAFGGMTTKDRKRKDDHLYEQWIDWDREMQQTVREVRYRQ